MPDTNEQTGPDRDLVKKIIDGDELAFKHLVERYQAMVFSTIYRYTGNADDAEDLAQEVFIKIWRSIASFKGKSKLSTWIYRITANHCLTYRKKKKKAPVSLDALDERGAEPRALSIDPDYDTKHKVSLVKEAIEKLPERQRMALILSQYEGRTYREIARIMDISVSSVESLIFRARTALKARFGKT